MRIEEVQTITILGILIALLFNARAYAQQANAIDVSNYLEIHNLITDRFRRLNQAKEDPQKKRAVTDVMNALEISCHLFNKKVIGKTTQEMLDNLLGKLLRLALKPQHPVRILIQERKDQTFFPEMEKFATSHNIDFPPPKSEPKD